MYALQPDLHSRSRFPLARDSATVLTAAEAAALVVCGLVAAYGVMVLDFSLRLPGHSILRAVLPMSVGLALVPRRGAGVSMSAVALGASCLGAFGGWFHLGAGSTTSLVLVGPLLDLAGRWGRQRGRLVAAFAVAGLATNVVALVARGGSKLLFQDGRPFASWVTTAAWSYPLCGLVAGTVAAIICFRMRSTADGDDLGEPGEPEPAP